MMIMIILAILLYFWSLYNIDAGNEQKKKKQQQQHLENEKKKIKSNALYSLTK